MTPLASIHGLTVCASDGTVILEGIDLDLTPGTVTGIVGPSGAGKTTLGHALLGHLGPGLHRTDGTVRVAGHDPFTDTGRHALRGRVTGYVPQDPASALNPRRRIRRQLRTAARIAHAGEDRRCRADRITGAVRAASLEEHLLHRHPARLSGGQAQRALLAWTLITRPRLIILDEPTSGLDPATALAASAAFTALPWRPAILLISHDPVLVSRMADRTLTIVAGRVQPAPPRRCTEPAAGHDAGSSAHPSSPAEVALSVEDLTITYGGPPVVDAASFGIAPAEMLALRGASGSGKTSLARAVAGLKPPAAGQLRLRDVPVGWDATVRARAGGPFLAYVGQDARAALNPHEPVRRTLERALTAAARNDRCCGWGLSELLDRFELDHALLERRPDGLSGGQRHRVALARAVAAAPAVLICDESTASLDADTEARVLDALDVIRRERGTPILLITHRDRVADRADRCLTLDQGLLR